MNRLDGKVAIITGGARGQGEAHVRMHVAEGAKVVFTDLLTEAGEALARELGENAIFLEHDVRDSAGWDRVVKTAEDNFGLVTILINNAGVDSRGLLSQLTEEEYRRVVDICQVGVFLGMKAVFRSMKKAGGGSIINVASTAGLVGVPSIPYTAAKHAVIGMTKAAAIELGPLNIRVNAIVPGPINTPMLPPDLAKEWKVPLDRIGEPIEIARMGLFLASDEASFSTGGYFTVDGGMTCQSAPAPTGSLAANLE